MIEGQNGRAKFDVNMRFKTSIRNVSTFISVFFSFQVGVLNGSGLDR